MNDENLIPVSRRSKSEVRELGRKGGVASGESRRRRKQLREYAEMVMSMPLEGANRARLESMGIAEEDLTNGMAMVMTTFNQALKGNPKHIQIMREMLGERVLEHKVTTNLDAAAQELNDLIEETESGPVD